jgi:hypothetical protein
MSKKWPFIVCPHCAWGYSRMEYTRMQRRSGQDEMPCENCGGEISSHDPKIIPPKGAILPKFKL